MISSAPTTPVNVVPSERTGAGPGVGQPHTPITPGIGFSKAGHTSRGKAAVVPEARSRASSSALVVFQRIVRKNVTSDGGRAAPLWPHASTFPSLRPFQPTNGPRVHSAIHGLKRDLGRACRTPEGVPIECTPDGIVGRTGAS